MPDDRPVAQDTPAIRFAVHVHGPLQIYAAEEGYDSGVYHVAQLGGMWDQRIQFAGDELVPNGVTPQAMLSVVMDRILKVASRDPKPGYLRAIKFMGLAIEAIEATREEVAE